MGRAVDQLKEMYKEFQSSPPPQKIQDGGLLASLFVFFAGMLTGNVPAVLLGAVAMLGNQLEAEETSFNKSDYQ